MAGQLNFQGRPESTVSWMGKSNQEGWSSARRRGRPRSPVRRWCTVAGGQRYCQGKIELVAARLYGNIVTPRLTIAEGVVFDGDCSGNSKTKSWSREYSKREC
jgi:hypothetical protein